MKDKKEEPTLSPLHYLLMSIFGMPTLSLKFGLVALVGMTPLTILFIFQSYQFYQKRALDKNISYREAIAKDLPDMSPIHIFFFLLISAPITLGFFSSAKGIWIGFGLVYFIYSVYYYGFRPKKV